MNYKYSDLIDENLSDQCDQIRSIANRNWLNSAHVSLAHLDQIKAKVYNVALADAQDLRLNHVQEASRGNSDLDANPPLSRISLQKNAWGSDNAISEVIKQHSEKPPSVRQRPSSAKYAAGKFRPPSGKKPRPQSATEPLPSTEGRQPFAVKGAKFDPSSRPPKGVPQQNVTTGWVGPPAGLKYPDKTDGPVKLTYMNIVSPIPPAAPRCTPVPPRGTPAPVHETPPAPMGSPVPADEAPMEDQWDEDGALLETKNKMFEVFLNINDQTAEDDEDLFGDDSEDDELIPSPPAEVTPSPALLRRPTPELHLNLPTADDSDADDNDSQDTERLLQEAEKLAKMLDLKNIVKTNSTQPETNEQQTEGITMVTTNQYSDLDNGHVAMEADTPNDEVQTQMQADNLHNRQNELNVLQSSQSKQTAQNQQEQTATSQTGKLFGEDTANQQKDEMVFDYVAAPIERVSVKFSEDRNITVDITPRNLGRKVTELNTGVKRKPVRKPHLNEIRELTESPPLTGSRIQMSPVTRTRPPSGKSQGQDRKGQSVVNKGGSIITGSKIQAKSSSDSETLIETATGTNQKAEIGHLIGTRPNSANPRLGALSPTGCSKLHVTNRPKSASCNKGGVPIPTVSVAYVEEGKEDKGNKEGAEKKLKKKKKAVSQDVVTMVQKISLSDDDGQSQASDEKDTTSTSFADPDAPLTTVFKSEPPKNYYELSRHSSQSHRDENNSEATENTAVYKTTKTIEFDELKPKEVSIKSIIDPQMTKSKEYERFMSSTPLVQKELPRGRQLYRPPSAKVSKKPPVPTDNKTTDPSDLERPFSRRGFVAMAPEKAPSIGETDKRKVHQRPWSAPSRGRKSPAKDKENKQRAKSPEKTEEKTAEQEKEEREKVIDNLLERTKTLLGENNEESDDVEKKIMRPSSAVTDQTIAKSKTASTRRVRSAGTRRPDGCPHGKAFTDNHKHYDSYSRAPPGKRKASSGGKKKIVYTEPCIINTKTSFSEEDTSGEHQACVEMEKQLAERGVNIRAETLERALYPPAGRTKYYEITTTLPRSNSLTLLSHPRVWLPEEHKKLKMAEKTLSRANELMYLQKRAEERRARLEAMGGENKAKKKKGKKGKKKLRRSNSFG